jgi:hypothetical protein
MLYDNISNTKKLRISAFIPKPHVSTIGSPPPKVTDISFYISRLADADVESFKKSPVLLNFKSNKHQIAEKTPATRFHIEIQILDYKVKWTYIQKAADKPYHLFDRTEENHDRYLDSIKNDTPYEELPYSSSNTRMVITPINEHGLGPNSVFFLPLSSLRYLSEYNLNHNPITGYLQDKAHLFLPDANDRSLMIKNMFIYLDTDKPIIEQDRLDYLDNKWKYTTPYNNWREINSKNFRWCIHQKQNYDKLTEDGWQELNKEEIEFIDNVIYILKTEYRTFLSERGSSFGEPHVFKLAVPHPFIEKDTLIIYIMKGMKWHL